MPVSKIRQSVNRQITLATDVSIALRIWYRGEGVATIDVGASSVGAASGDMTFLIGGVADVRVNPDSGVDPGSIDESAEATTIGAMADLINANSDTSFWFAALVDSLRASDSTDTLAINTGAVDSQNGVKVFWDSSAILRGMVCIGAEALGDDFGPAWARVSSQAGLSARDPGTTTAALTNVATENVDNEVRLDTASRLKRILATIGIAGAPTIGIYSCTQFADTLLQTIAFTEDTEEDHTFGDNEIISDLGARIVVATVDAVDAWDITLAGFWGEPGEI